MREIIFRAEDADRDLTAEERTEFDRTEAAFDSLTGRVKRLERGGGLQPVLSRGLTPNDDGIAGIRGFGSRYTGMDAMAEWIRARGNLGAISPEARSLMEQRAPYAVGASGTGGYTVPADWNDRLIEVLTQFGVVESLADSAVTTDHGQLHMPRVVEPGTASAAIVSEGGTYTETEDTFEEVLLDAYKYGHLAKASDEMLQDSKFDINGFIQRRAGRAIALKTNNHFVVGTGSSQPNGITNNTVGVTLSSGQTTTISSADSIIDLYHSLAVPYRGNAVFLLHDQTLKVVRKLKDSTNQYLWQPGLQAGVPDLLLGRPVYIDPDMPTPAANAISIVFGDIRQNYIVRSVAPVSVKVLTELYAANGYVGFRVDRRVDGDIQDAAAARTLKQSAT